MDISEENDAPQTSATDAASLSDCRRALSVSAIAIGPVVSDASQVEKGAPSSTLRMREASDDGHSEQDIPLSSFRAKRRRVVPPHLERLLLSSSDESVSDIDLLYEPNLDSDLDDSDGEEDFEGFLVEDRVIDDTAEPVPDEVEEADSNVPSKTGFEWTTLMPPPHRRTWSGNIVREQPGLKGPALNAISKLDFFRLFMTQDIIDLIVMHTNEEIARQRQIPTKANLRDTTEVEVLAFVGMLLTMGCLREGGHYLDMLWSETLGRPIYRATMSAKRFRELLSYLRFDNKETHAERRALDKLAPIKELWDLFNEQLLKMYVPGAHICLDEMLSLFRGVCAFRQYLPSKPGKYGVLVRLLVDCDTKYILGTLPYSGRVAGVAPGSKGMVTQLVSPFYKSNRNVTTDRYYTSVDLAQELYRNGITMVGTIQANRMHNPPMLSQIAGRELYSSLGIFSKHTPRDNPFVPITLVSYMARLRPAKNVLLLSTMHSDVSIPAQINGKDNLKQKPEVIAFYNQTMGGVDTVDQMVRRYHCKRATRRWPFTLFCTLVDMMALNAYTLHKHKFNECSAGVKGFRLKFLLGLGTELCKPHAESRLSQTNMSFNLRTCITNTFKLGVQDVGHAGPSRPSEARPVPARKRCAICMKVAGVGKKANVHKASETCSQCSTYVCKAHVGSHTLLCEDCLRSDSD